MFDLYRGELWSGSGDERGHSRGTEAKKMPERTEESKAPSGLECEASE